MSWNYRLVRHKETVNGRKILWFAIHEVYYDRKKRPNRISVDAIPAHGDKPHEVMQDLSRMLSGAVLMPIVNYDDPCFGPTKKKRRK